MFKGNKIIMFVLEVAVYVVLITALDSLFTRYSSLSFGHRTIYEIFIAVMLMFIIKEVLRRNR